VKKGGKLFSSVLKAMSVGMAMLLLYVTVIQALHHHATPTNVNDICDSGENVNSTNKCAVCDYLSHHHFQEYHLPAVDQITVPVVKTVTLLTRSYTGIYKFTLQGFTNKGPPPVSHVTIFTA
jgi:hypothetical protein